MGRRLGQHFLKGAWAARALARAAAISEEDTVLEIGPGKGALTRELLLTGARIIALEKDASLVELLREKFADEIAAGKLTVISDDVRNALPKTLGLENGKYIVAANIPYYITGEILRQFLTAETQPKRMALLVQKEVAQRIISKRESILSLSVKAYGVPKIVAKVPRGNFSPPPSVDSAIIVIDGISRGFFDTIAEKGFFDIVRAGFASKRKFLSGNLVNHGYKKGPVLEAFLHCGILEKARAEEIPLEKWKPLTQQLKSVATARSRAL